MEFKKSEADTPVELTYDEFCELVRGGRVPPTAWYCVAWEGDWRTVDNYPPFHRHSPVKYLLGPKLVEKQSQKERERLRASEYQRLVAQYQAAIEESYALRPLDELAVTDGAVGAARLRVRPSFDPDRVVTVVFRPEHLDVEMAGNRFPLSHYLPHEVARKDMGGNWFLRWTEAKPLSPEHALRGRSTVPYGRAPVLFRSWSTFAAHALRLESCSTDTLDGAGYEHEIASHGAVKRVEWSNPQRAKHAPQVAVVQAYIKLAKRAGLRNLLGLCRHP